MRGRRRATWAVSVCLFALAACSGPAPQSGLPEGTVVIATDGGDVRVEVEIAETDEAKSTGLMHRVSLPDDAGMVFLEDEPVRYTFTMRDVTIPLSLAVWGRDGRIRSIIDMDPCEAEPCPSHDTGAAWVGALEVNQGFFEDRGVEVGDAVRLER